MGRGLIQKRKHKKRPPFPQSLNPEAYPVLAIVSNRYSELLGRSSTRYSPVRRCTRPRKNFLARLACVRHAASVQSEPESNSPVKIERRSAKNRPKATPAKLICRIADLFSSLRSLFTCQRTDAHPKPTKALKKAKPSETESRCRINARKVLLPLSRNMSSALVKKISYSLYVVDNSTN